MKLTLASLAAALCLSGASAASKSAGEFAIQELFKNFEEKFERKYASDEERKQKFATFVANVERIVQKNEELAAMGKDQVHGITKFADWTQEEFRNIMLDPKIANASTEGIPVSPNHKKSTTTSLDWRDSGVVTDVKNQGYCGSCWAFSATETVESQYALNGGDLTELSVQTTVACDTTDGGCGGGWYYTAWMDYMEGNGGITTESIYPYASSSGTSPSCDSSLESQVVSGTAPASYTWATTPCSSFSCNSQDEDTLQSNLESYGPISIACDASEWSSYTGGVLTSSSCSSSALRLDHAIQLVGFNAEASTPYWIVRNSWDTTWGEDGYIYLEMGTNTCGIADKAAMVTLA